MSAFGTLLRGKSTMVTFSVLNVRPHQLCDFTRLVLSFAAVASTLTCALAQPISNQLIPPGKTAAPSVPFGPYRISVDKNVFIIMRDGVRLATDLYYPVDALTGLRLSAPLATVLTRTPYGKGAGEFRGYGDETTHRWDVLLDALVTNGYVVAIQDFRGRWASEGALENESAMQHKDGYDTIQWIAHQTWSNGRVGMTGCSSGGESQLAAASLEPPALKALNPQAAGGISSSVDGYIEGAMPWSAYVGLGAEHGHLHSPRLSVDLPHDVYNETAAQFDVPKVNLPFDHVRAVWHLPEVQALEDQGIVDSYFRSHFDKSATTVKKKWDAVRLDATYRSNTPALFVDSWYNVFTGGALRTFNWFRDKSSSAESRENQYIIVGPSTHCSDIWDTADLKVGERPLGATPFNYWKLFLTWFDALLKQDPRAIQEIASWPHVRYYALGVNEWRAAPTWPPPGTSLVHYYLGSETTANSLFGNGTLELSKSTSGADRDSYTYDPGNPVQSIGGHSCCTGTELMPAGAFDQRPVEARQDVLVYTTGVFDRTLDVTGEILVKLFVGATAVDTDFTAKLVDVSPDGRAFNILESIQRARYREGPEKEVWMEAGKVYPITIHLGSISNVFLAGHRLRLEISSSNFPSYDRNLGLGGDNARQTRYVVSHNSVFHSAKYPSEIILPILANPRPAN